MKCYFCNNDLDIYIKDYYSAFKCIDCKFLYISKDKFNDFLNNYLNQLNIDETNKNYVLAKLDLSNLNILNLIPKSDKSCKCSWKCNRTLCSIFYYKYNYFKFWHCNYTNYYCFYETNLIKAINKIIFKFKIQKLSNKIKKKIISLYG